MTPSFTELHNYLVPAGGACHGVTFQGLFSSTALLVDWRQFSIDNFPFQPQGAFIDNSQGTSPIIITILPLNYSVSMPAGISGQVQFPAPNGQTCTITGNGQATIVFADFPVMPEKGSTAISGTVTTNAQLQVYTGTAWDNADEGDSNTDAQAALQLGQLSVVSRLQGFNGTTYDRLRTLVDNSDAMGTTTTGLLGVVSKGVLWNGSTWARQLGAVDNADAQATSATANKTVTLSRGAVFNGATFDRQRTTNIFKSATATAAGNTAIWTPAAGKKFRLMRVTMKLTNSATLATAGNLLAQLFDGAAGVIGIANNWFVGASGNTQHQSYNFDLGNGYLSSAANNVLNVNLSAALTAGLLSITVAGTEE
jgi:hypothetical protein